MDRLKQRKKCYTRETREKFLFGDQQNVRETYSSIEYGEQLKSTGTERSWSSERERDEETFARKCKYT